MKEVIEESRELDIVDVVETLSQISGLDLKSDVGVVESSSLMLWKRKVEYSRVHWLQREEMEGTIDQLKEVYASVLRYLRQFYAVEKDHLHQHKSMENIKDIMVLVGEAGSKLDKFFSLSKEKEGMSVTHSKEFRELQDFYQKKIANQDNNLVVNQVIPHKITQRGAKISLARRKGIKSKVVDMEGIRSDRDYELFYLRKDKGKRFYSEEMARNLKLVSDYGGHLMRQQGKDPLLRVKIWRDRMRHAESRNILAAVSYHLDNFYQFYRKHQSMDFALALHKMTMALLLCANPANLLRNAPAKCCGDYFVDFLDFLREALGTRDYQKMLHKMPDKSHRGHWAMLELCFAACRALYTMGQGLVEVQHVTKRLLQESVKGKKKEVGVTPLSDTVEGSYAKMCEIFLAHPDGPLNKVLQTLNSKKHSQFDTLHQGNIPSRLFSMFYGSNKVVVVRMGSPTRQAYVDQVQITDEFRGFLRGYQRDPARKKHLLFNLQDRTSWREHHRCRVVEELSKSEPARKFLSVVTLSKSTDFYHQRAPYQDAHDFETFSKQFQEQLEGENAGFYFPDTLESVPSAAFMELLMERVHRVFFGARNSLSRQERLDFIELTYLLIQLKVMDELKPTSLSFSCKDGVDVGMAASVQLYLFLTLLGKGELEEGDWDYLLLMVHGPSMLLRERAMIPEVFERMVQAIRRVELARVEASTPRAFLTKVTKEFKGIIDLDLLRHTAMRAPQPTRSY